MTPALSSSSSSSPPPAIGDSTCVRLAQNLRTERYAFMSGDVMTSWLELNRHAWTSFTEHWDNLTLDRHMADGGTYRFRRYGQFELQRPCALKQLPHGPYEQPSDINPLNGGVQRHFDPLDAGFVQSCVLTRLLNALASTLDTAEGRKQCWNIRLHPYRIRADLDISGGHPTPEGLHRDGVDYVATLMVQRHNVEGGETLVTDNEKKALWWHTLREPMDFLISDDRHTMHSVTPVTPTDRKCEAYRDVLVIAFTKTAAP